MESMEEERTIKEVWDLLEYEQKLAATAYIFEKLCEHRKQGGTFRYLIYDRLGFNQDAYIILYGVGGMKISNEFNRS